MKGWHILTGKRDGAAHWYNDFCIYFGDKQGAPFIRFHFPLHSGWQSYPLWMKGGWDYYEPAVLVGRLYSDESKWIRLGRWIIPARIGDTYRRVRGRNYTEVLKEDDAA